MINSRWAPWVLALLMSCDDPRPPAPEGAADATPVALEPGVGWPLPEREPWPGPEWPRATAEEAGLDPAGLARLEAWAFQTETGEALRTDALVIVRGGKLVYEKYANETTATTPLLTWSVTKSVANTLVGVAVKDGLIGLNDPAAKYYPELSSPGQEKVRITDLLRMSGGLAWSETYEGSPVQSQVLQMLYTRGRGDTAKFAASRGMEAPAGTRWEYSSGTTNILMAALKGAVPAGSYERWPWEKVFGPLGMKTAVLERDGAGTFIGSSYLYASGPDMARWAQLYLDDGVWQGQRILPEGWVRYTTTLAPAYLSMPVEPAHYEDNPGAQWYVNRGDPARGVPPPFPKAPADLFGAQGHWGKRVWVMPSLDLIVVRMGDDRKKPCHDGKPEGCIADLQKVYNDDTLLDLVLGSVRP